MLSVHLGVVELKGDGQIISEQLLSVPAPDDEWIIEYAAVHAHSAVNFGVNYCGCAYHHAVCRKVNVLTVFESLTGAFQIVAVEFIDIFTVHHIAGT